MSADASMSLSSRVNLEKYQQIEDNLRQVSHLRSHLDEQLAVERSQADKVQSAFQNLLREYVDVCKERDRLTGGRESTDATASSELQSLRAENDALKAELAKVKESTAALSAKYKEDRDNWAKFRKWWDGALAAKQQRGNSAKKPRLTTSGRHLIDKVGLATPSASKTHAHTDNDCPRARVRVTDDQVGDGSPAVVNRKTTAAITASSVENPVTPVTHSSVSLLSADPVRMRNWLDHVDQRPPTSSDSLQQDSSSNTTKSARERSRNSQDRATGQQQDRVAPVGRKRRRLSESPQDSHASSREPLGDLSPNDTGRRSCETVRSAGSRNGEHSETSLKQKTSPVRSQARRRITPIKAESDDECARDCAVARTQHRATRGETPPELSREELLRKRKAEMEDLRNNPWKYRGRGRYAAELQRSEHRAGRLTLRPELNGGVTYEHNDVVRDRSTRKRMHAHDCPCCKDYWDLVGPAAAAGSEASRPPSQSLARRSGLTSRSLTDGGVTVIHIESDDEDDHVSTQARRHRAEGNGTSATDMTFSKRQRQRERDLAVLEEEREQERLAQERRQRAGRHRAWGRPAATPEGFWEISFPDTPRKDEINDSARKQRVQKMVAMANDPRYQPHRG